MKNETNTQIQNQINEIIYENIITNDNQSENSEDKKQMDETIQENIILNHTTDLQDEKLEQIHQDLGIICSFLIIFALVIMFRYIYKFFDMFFKI